MASVCISLIIFVSMLFQQTASQCSSTGTGCITSSSFSCRNLPDGHYQSCESCNRYHSCSGGVIWPDRLCPLTNRLGLNGRLVWRQVTSDAGICDYTSDTCIECAVSTGGGGSGSGRCLSTGTGCLSAATTNACVGRPAGDYQACEDCTVYHSCSSGQILYANRPCPLTNRLGLRGKLVWQKITANYGECNYTSSSCVECVTYPSGGPTGGGSEVPQPTVPASTCNTGTSSGTICLTANILSCLGRPDGDYQSCDSCTVYHTCSNGLISANRPCARRPDGSLLVWVTLGLGRGRCEWSSSTCQNCSG